MARAKRIPSPREKERKKEKKERKEKKRVYTTAISFVRSRCDYVSLLDNFTEEMCIIVEAVALGVMTRGDSGTLTVPGQCMSERLWHRQWGVHGEQQATHNVFGTSSTLDGPFLFPLCVLSTGMARPLSRA
ncbi:hypothetical protein WMY93_025755 [Mugilogobius chulae]|uniref:Uncharacterized protein n=1 Tax=Mugilogobius chulae TaxID=88201 RepID=A0AAW0MX75_9GOBI